jgi:hypothetical protein
VGVGVGVLSSGREDSVGASLEAEGTTDVAGFSEQAPKSEAQVSTARSRAENLVKRFTENSFH